MIDRYPLPWRVSQEGPPSIVDANGQYVFERASGDGLASIVRAVNSRADLLAACKSARDDLLVAVREGCDLPDFDPREHTTIKMLDDAIAKGEGAA